MYAIKKYFFQVVLPVVIGIMGLSYANQVVAQSVTMNTIPGPVIAGITNVSGIVLITGQATDSNSGAHVTLLLNSGILGTATFTGGFCTPGQPCANSWSFVWNTTTTANGSYVVAAILSDNAGGFSAAQQPVLVTNAIVPMYSCLGFSAPFNTAIALKSKTQRSIPLIAQIFDSNNNIVTSSNIPGNAPIVDVSFMASNSLTTTDVTNDLLSPGNSSTGNVFQYDPTSQTWTFNLSTQPYSAAGTYTVSMRSGDVTKYSFGASCQQAFVRAP